MTEYTTEDIRQAAKILRAGEQITLTGTVYTARDAAHKRFFELLDRGEKLPFELDGAIIYYTGPTPAPPGRAVGSCGPTTSGRMDGFTPRLLDLGLAAMIGKGERSKEVAEAIVRNGAVYLCAIGGAGALMANCVTRAQEIAFPELGCESVKRLTVEKLPLIVGLDSVGGSVFWKDGGAK
ncbi:MAG: FumA C-terminus/TtdB family hydratase beta subunit [Oscillospiraceae bacterium]|jgi:fumarate hydratase subunit beta|nr:FumA C-terminus/TtdB family hydratase beta subunit [Oscillospiraceae bacterium]